MYLQMEDITYKSKNIRYLFISQFSGLDKSLTFGKSGYANGKGKS